MYKKLFLTVPAVFLALTVITNIASAINLGYTVVDNEIPETMLESSFDAENPGINFGLCAGFNDVPESDCLLTPKQIEEIIEYDDVPIEEYIKIPEPIQQAPPQTTTPIIAEVKPPVIANNTVEEAPEDEKKILGISKERESLEELVGKLSVDINKKFNKLRNKIDKNDPAVFNMFLIVILIIMAMISIRSELRFQQLAEKYKYFKKHLSQIKRDKK